MLPHRRPASRPLVLALVLALAAAACGRATQGGPDGQGGPTDADAPSGAPIIVASPWPLAWLASAIAPDRTVHTLGTESRDAHDLELTPAEQALVLRADVVVHVGDLGFQPRVERALTRRSGPVVSMAEEAGSLLRPPPGEDGHTPDDQEATAAAHADPHLWFDPRTLAAAAPAIARELARVDPAGAAGYRRRAATTAAALRALARHIAALLSECRVHTAVVSHAAFGYLLGPHGLEQVSVTPSGAHGDVSPARLAELSELIRAHRLAAVLAEPVEGRAAAETLAREAGVALREVDSLESPPVPARALGYPTLLRRQAEAFADVLECAR